MNFANAFEIAQSLPKKTAVICANDKNAQLLVKYLKLLVGNNFKIAYLPSPQTLLYEQLEPSPHTVSQRLQTLYAWQTKQLDCIVMSINTFARPLPTPNFISNHCLKFLPGDRIDPIKLRASLIDWNYEHADFVCDPGTFAIRGSIVDIFPFQSELPYRLELFDDTVESIYSINSAIITQIPEISIFPDKEYELSAETIANFNQKWQQNFGLWGQKSEIYLRTQKAKVYAGMHQWLNWLYQDGSSWQSYLQAEVTLVELNSQAEYEKNYIWAHKHYLNHNADAAEPLIPIFDLTQAPDTVAETLASATKFGPKLLINTKQATSTLTFYNSLHEAQSAAETGNKTKFIAEQGNLFSWLQKPHTGNYSMHVDINVASQQINNVLIKTAATEVKTKKPLSQTVQPSPNLTIGNYVVHAKYGIGQLSEITTLEHSGEKYECVVIKYANAGKIFVPIGELDQLAKFKEVQADDNVQLSTLGKKNWQHKQAKIIQKIVDDAAQLLKLQAKRKQQKRTIYQFKQPEFSEFLGRFPFEDTKDQAEITKVIVKDLTELDYPMDRLVCGDVGFGKTEIALRASWLAMNNGLQVVWLAPTTVLARQHVNRIQERFLKDCFNALPCFGGKKLTSAELASIADGQTDIIIGTHAVLNSAIKFKNLALVVIDEEHKFGVKQKNALLERYPLVDILSLSATPIPRSLNMALSSLRDISLLASPPAERLDIKTFVDCINDTEVVEHAIMRELQRGGQVYYCYNRIEKLAAKQAELQKIFPESSINIVHGQMRREQITQQMHDFALQKTDILLCSSIVESGLDFANANTLIVYRADLFGLSQLHQLRGRVGRGKQQAYAYFLVPEVEHQTKDCQARIQAIQANSSLGSGFALAIEDLEIRGAGNILGKQQSGHIIEVGFQHYMKLLQETMSWLEKHPNQELDIDKLLATKEFSYSVPYPVLIPESYIHEPNVRLASYQNLALCSSHSEIDKLRLLWLERYGQYPEEIANLLDIAHVKLDLMAIDVSKLFYDSSVIELCFRPGALSAEQVSILVAKPEKYGLKPDDKLLISRAKNLRAGIATLMLDLKHNSK